MLRAGSIYRRRGGRHAILWQGLGTTTSLTREEMYAIMKERGVPIDDVGLQCHFRHDSLPRFADMDANIKRLAALGLEVAFTEVDS